MSIIDQMNTIDNGALKVLYMSGWVVMFIIGVVSLLVAALFIFAAVSGRLSRIMEDKNDKAMAKSLASSEEFKAKILEFSWLHENSKWTPEQVYEALLLEVRNRKLNEDLVERRSINGHRTAGTKG